MIGYENPYYHRQISQTKSQGHIIMPEHKIFLIYQIVDAKQTDCQHMASFKSAVRTYKSMPCV